jgi:hypothetical protein
MRARIYALAALVTGFAPFAVAAPVDLSGVRLPASVHDLAFFAGIDEVDFNRVTSSRYVFVGSDPELPVSQSRSNGLSLGLRTGSRSNPRLAFGAAPGLGAVTGSPSAFELSPTPQRPDANVAHGAGGRNAPSIPGEIGRGIGPIAVFNGDRIPPFVELPRPFTPIEPSPNPLPATAWLFGTIVAGYLGFQRWRKGRSTVASVVA